MSVGADNRRVAVIGILIEDRERAAAKVNETLAHYADLIVGRMGVPYKDRGVSVIALIIDGTTDEIGAITGKLGNIKGVKVKAALTS